MAGGSNFPVKFNWNNNIFQNVQTLAVIEKYMDSPKKWIRFEMTEGINFAVESEWKSKVSQRVQNLFCFKKVDGFLEKRSWIFLLRC